MWTCPVCEKESSSAVCTNCSFDSSCDYEVYPTLQQPEVLPDAVSLLTKHRIATPTVENALSALRSQGWDEHILSAIEIILRSATDGSGYYIALALSEHPSTASTGIRLMQRIATAGDDKAQLWLGQSFYTGNQVPTDLQVAAYWYQKAAAQGNEVAKSLLKEWVRNEISETTVNELVRKFKLESIYLLRGSKEFKEIIENAIDTYAGSARYEIPLLMEDHSYSGSGKTGFILTTKALYYNGGFIIGKIRCPFARINSVSISCSIDEDLYCVNLSILQNDSSSSIDMIRISSSPNRYEAIRMACFWKELLHLA